MPQRLSVVKFKKVMKEFAEGKLKSSNGTIVRSPKQAVAIAYSEARLQNQKSKSVKLN